MLIPFILFFIWATWRAKVKNELRQEWDRYREAGLPTAANELFQYPPEILESHRNSDAIDAAITSVVDIDEFNRLWRADQEDPYTTEAVQEELARRGMLKDVQSRFQSAAEFEVWEEYTGTLVRNYIAENAVALSAIEEALKTPFKRYIDTEYVPDEWSNSWEHSRKALLAIEILRMRVHVELEEGNIEGAAQAVLLMFRLSNSTREEPVYESQRLRTRGDRQATYALQSILNRGELSEATLGELQRFTSEIACRLCWTNALAGDLVTQLDFVGSIRSAEPVMAIFDMVGVYDSSTVNILRRMREHIDFLQDPWYAQDETRRKLTQPDDESISPFQIMTGFFSMGMYTYYDGVVSSMALAQGNSATSTVALAVERYRLAEEALPSSLDLLVPRFIEEIPLNPFTGAPVSFELLETGYRVHTIIEGEGYQVQRNNENNTFTVTR